MEIAVVSGKGGTGKSSLSAAFATLGEQVAVADCDVDAANLYLLFNPSHEEEEVYIAGFKAIIDYSLCSGCGLCAQYCRFDAISITDDRVAISETSCDGCFLCSRICPERAITMVQNDKSRMYTGQFRYGRMVYGRLAPGEENSGKLVNMIRNKVKQVAEDSKLSTIILDGPPGIGCPVISTIAGVDRVVVVTEPTISGLHDMQRTVELIHRFKRNPYVIINKYDLNPEMSLSIYEWAVGNGVEILGHLPFDPVMVDAMVQGQTVIEYSPNAGISKKIRNIWNKIIE
jgi:MinD superfamily P-loop ATPase